MSRVRAKGRLRTGDPDVRCVPVIWARLGQGLEVRVWDSGLFMNPAPQTLTLPLNRVCALRGSAQHVVHEAPEPPLRPALPVHQVFAIGHLGVQKLVRVHAQQLERAFSPKRVLATRNRLVRLVLQIPPLPGGDRGFQNVSHVRGPHKLPGIRRVRFRDEHLDPGQVVSLLAELDVNRDAGGGRGGAERGLRFRD